MSGRERTNVTVVEVGQLACVSGRTVSRVINKDPAVSRETRDRVLAAIAELKFRPNLAARSLRSARSFNLVLFTRQFSSFYFSEAVRGAAKGCAEHGYNLIIQEAPGRDGGRWDELFARLRMDGAILLPPLVDETELLNELTAFNVRYASVSPGMSPKSGYEISADDDDGVRQLVRHLWALGHRTFGYIGGPAHLASNRIRNIAFNKALGELGVAPEHICLFEMRHDLESGHDERGASITNAIAGAEAIDALHGLQTRPTALFAFSDEVATGAMARALEQGLRVPDELAIAGFDNADIGLMLRPQLTTIAQPIMEMVRAAVTYLVGKETDLDPAIFPVSFIARGSTVKRDEAH